MTASRRPTRQLIAALLAVVAAFALVGSSCGDDDSKSSDKSTTTEKSGDDDSDSSDSTPEDTTAKVSDEEFEKSVSAITDEIDAVDDPCGLFDVLSNSSGLPDPSTPAQIEGAVTFIESMLNKMAELSDDPAVAEDFTAAGQAWRDYGESVDYDPKEMDLNGDGPDLGEIDYYGLVNQWYDDNAEACGLGTAPEGTDGTTPEDGATDPGAGTVDPNGG